MLWAPTIVLYKEVVVYTVYDKVQPTLLDRSVFDKVLFLTDFMVGSVLMYCLLLNSSCMYMFHNFG